MSDFEDARLDDPDALAAGDSLLRPLAEAGARLRREVAMAEEPLRGLDDSDRPRALIAVGPEARLLRAVLEPTCPVPFVAWPSLGLPAWVGPLDIVVVLGGAERESTACAHEALRRGSRLVVVAQPGSSLASSSASRATTLLPVSSSDPLVAAIVALLALHELGLGPHTSTAAIADAMDAVAQECSHALDLAVNPAKALALELADTTPLVWGGSVLAARASRRLAEAFRGATGRVALAADAPALAPILAATPARDPFADPFDGAGDEGRPSLVVVEDGLGDPAAEENRSVLEANAAYADVRVSVLAHEQGQAMERYATVLQKGRFAAAYLQIGLGRAGWDRAGA